MRTRLLRNWRSSLLGGALLITIIILLITHLITGTEFIAILPTIIGLFYLPDPPIRHNNHNHQLPKNPNPNHSKNPPTNLNNNHLKLNT